MIKSVDNNSSQFDICEIRGRYEKLAAQSSGFSAQLGKRISSPDDLVMIPAFYRLFPGVSPSDWHRRVAFIIPFLKHSGNCPSLGEFIGTQERLKKVGNLEKRVLQIVRASLQQHADVIYLRRLLILLKEPTVNWNTSGLAQFFSIGTEKNSNGKKRFIEQYFIAREKTGKGE